MIAAMRSDRVISTIDFHTAGIGMRLLTSGLGRLPGATIGAKRRFFQEHHEDLRTGLCLEPRGHRSLLIAVMTEPVTPGAHFGLFFIYPGGYYVSCGEGTIGAATVAIETGMVPRLGAETPVVIDTEAGAVETLARVDGDRVREVTLRWTPSFVVAAGQRVEVESVGEVLVDVAVGAGNVFAIVEARTVGVAVRRELAKRIAQRGMAVHEAVNAQLEMNVPGLGKASVDNVLVHELPDGAGVSPNALVWGPGQVDAAPCGSGTCARMALFHHRGLMEVGGTDHEPRSPGPRLHGAHRERDRGRGPPAILPEITGTSYLTGFSQFLFDRRIRCGPATSSRGDRVKTLVLGGGVVGVTTAYFLAKAGHEVTLVEEKDALGLEASSGNAGIIAPGHSFAWASPRAPRHAVGVAARRRDARSASGSRPTLGLYTWGLRFLRECTADRARRNTLIKLRLCQYSQAVMNELVRAERIEYHAIAKRRALSLPRRGRARGGHEEDGAARRARPEAGDSRRARRRQARSGLRAGQGKIAGAIRDVGDSSGDSRLFVENLARVCARSSASAVKLGRA